MEKQFKPVPDVECLKYHGTPEKPDIKIFVSHRIDQDSETIDNPLYIPVRCGAVYDDREGVTMLGDDTGENISEKRMSFNELTIQYWVWKNVEADYYGLCHYRRFLSFSEKVFQTDTHTQLIHEDYIGEEKIIKYGLDEMTMRKTIEKYDIITAETVHLDKINFEKNNFTHWDLYYRGYGKTFTDKYVNLLFDVIAEVSPEYLDAAKAYFRQSNAKFCNCYIMKKELFHKYNEWLFSILLPYSKKIDMTDFSLDQMRMPGMMSEALFGIFYFKMLKEKKYKTRELQLIWFLKPEKEKLPCLVTDSSRVPVVLSSSNEYVPHLCVTISSIIANSNRSRFYDLIILNNGLSKQSERLINLAVLNSKNFKVTFCDVGRYISKFNFIVHNHIGVQTFYRLLIPSILPECDKAVYLDSDLVVNGDIAEIFDANIKDYYIGAVRDTRMACLYNFPDEINKIYNDETLKLEKPFDYFNAGVLVMNLEKIREKFDEKTLLTLAASKDWRFADQDLLNKIFEGKVYYFPICWNVQISFDDTRSEMKAPYNLYSEYLEARKNPVIVHYSGNGLPVNYFETDLSEYYWKYAKQSPLYEYSILRGALMASLNTQHGCSRARKFADKILPKGTRRREALKKILPKGSRRWEFCKKLYYKLGGK